MTAPIDLRTVRVIAKVRVGLADGTEEEWHIPTQLARYRPYFAASVYLPQGARIIDRSVEVRPLDSGQEIRVELQELYTALG